MPAEIIVYSNHMPTRLEQMELNPFQSKLVRETAEKQFSAVCLIEKSWLSELEKNTTQFEKKGIKHTSKELTKYFQKQNVKIPFVDGSNYLRYSSLLTSIQKVNHNNEKGKRYVVNFLAVSADLFNQARNDISKTYSSNEMNKGNYQNPLLNLINGEAMEAKVNLRERYIGDSENCLLVRQMIMIASRNDFPVLILGETGTGKEVVARNIHECSGRSNAPFLSINCGAIPTELFESELFGYMKGSHDTAYKDKEGLWELAHNGTLFLDEIGDLALNHQVKILKALEDGEIMRVGGTKKIKVNARIIAATNKKINNPNGDKNNEFRDDLYYRISTFIINTPALGSHREDIPKMASKIWKDLGNTNTLSSGVVNRLSHMNWPGNVRSLKHFLQRLSAIFGSTLITDEHIFVLEKQDLEQFFNPSAQKMDLQKPLSQTEFEKAVLKMEFLLKAAIYCEGKDQRNELLQKVRESLDALII